MLLSLLLFLLLNNVLPISSSWLMAAQLASALQSPDYYNCQMQPGLTKRQRDICIRHPAAMRSISDGLRAAIDACHTQFERERWNCSATFGGIGIPSKRIATPETAYIFAISAGGASGAVARACARGTIAECGCGGGEQTVVVDDAALPGVDPQQFVWAGCSDNVRYGNQFTRKFIDTSERHKRVDAKSLMNLHNNRVGRRILATNMRKQCKCHGVSGSCVTKTCWRTVPTMEELAGILKQKYANAKQVSLASDSALLVVLEDPSASFTGSPPSSSAIQPLPPSSSSARAERFLRAQTHYYSPHFAPPQPGRVDLVYLEPSPDYCTLDTSGGEKISGTSGRECFSHAECEQLCCGRGWETRREIRQEPCRCKFVWCCDVKCDTCRREVERRFCR